MTPKLDLKAVGERARDALDAEFPGEQLTRQNRAKFISALHAHLAPPSVRRTAWFRRTFAIPAFVTVAAAAVFWFWPVEPSFTVAGVPGKLGDALESGPNAIAVDFSSGNRVELSPQTRMSVVQNAAQLTRVRLDRGRASLSIKKQGRSFAVQAGLSTVTVTGTQFNVDFDDKTQRLQVALFEGSVYITGPCFPKPHHMVAGDHFSQVCNPGVAVAAPIPEPAPVSAPIPTATERHKANENWRALADAGRYGDALRAAQSVGFAAICRQASADELLALGDTARIGGNSALAKRAWQTLQQRFARSPQSAVAAFSLGRLSFDGDHDYAQAAGHFSRYLARAPSGPLAGDAWGRLLQARERAGLADAAARDGRAYLERFPGGPFVGLARRLVESEPQPDR
jgi:transmembrane sensor